MRLLLWKLIYLIDVVSTLTIPNLLSPVKVDANERINADEKKLMPIPITWLMVQMHVTATPCWSTKIELHVKVRSSATKLLCWHGVITFSHLIILPFVVQQHSFCHHMRLTLSTYASSTTVKQNQDSHGNSFGKDIYTLQTAMQINSSPHMVRNFLMYFLLSKKNKDNRMELKRY